MSDIGIKLIYWDRVLEAGFWILLTLFFYYLALRIQRALGGTPLANPVLLASAPIIALLSAADIWVGDYQMGGQALIWLLGPATVGLAVPLAISRACGRRWFRWLFRLSRGRWSRCSPR